MLYFWDPFKKLFWLGCGGFAFTIKYLYSALTAIITPAAAE